MHGHPGGSGGDLRAAPAASLALEERRDAIRHSVPRLLYANT